jgi:NADH:ubiquinone oxidoreductase subunit E
MAWEMNEAMAYFKKLGAPADQSAMLSLLQEIQEENGGQIPPAAITEVAVGLGVKESYLLALIKRFPRLHLGGGHCLELCAGPNCGKHAALADLAEKLIAQRSDVSLKFVPCMRQCGKGPNVKWDGTLYHKADEALLRKLLEK